jgi:hypothetical protein
MKEPPNDPAHRPFAGPNWSHLLGGVLLFLIGLVLGLFLLYYLARDLSIWVFGTHIAATVDELYVEQIGDRTEGELEFRYYARYHFTTPGGRTVADTTRLDVREWGALTEGGLLNLVYFPPYPAHNRLEERRFMPVLACAYLPLIIVTWIVLGLGWYLVRPAGRREWWFGRR